MPSSSKSLTTVLTVAPSFLTESVVIFSGVPSLSSSSSMITVSNLPFPLVSFLIVVSSGLPSPSASFSVTVDTAEKSA
ncbi:hypothetical protein [Pasteurella atlantica]|uniref:hypothetical protein n=1 Tax=Pasteurella atlantica TaxID=2827233 RepID=UPI0027692D89|nr:hypothetical protein [Pasteurella atlantica]MDP8107970.1 hypothetical protein [Pasteurella atlantica]